MQLTEPLNLRGGRNCWRDAESLEPSDLVRDAVEIAVIGAGVMGAMVAQRYRGRMRWIVGRDDTGFANLSRC